MLHLSSTLANLEDHYLIPLAEDPKRLTHLLSISFPTEWKLHDFYRMGLGVEG